MPARSKTTLSASSPGTTTPAPARRLTLGIIGSSGDVASVTLDAAAEAIGRHAAAAGYVVATLAEPGVARIAARGAMAAGGVSIGLSPATSAREHAHVYQRPDDAYDTVLYTGVDQAGQARMLARSCSALVFISGGASPVAAMIAGLGEECAVGILTGHGISTDEVAHIVRLAHRDATGIAFHNQPAALIRMVTVAARERQMA